jgi:hypothetical protein
MSAECISSTKVSMPLPLSIDNIDKEIALLQEAVGCLGKRIEPILSPAERPLDAAENEKEMISDCVTVGRLKSANASIRSIRAKVDVLLSRLAV